MGCSYSGPLVVDGSSLGDGEGYVLTRVEVRGVNYAAVVAGVGG